MPYERADRVLVPLPATSASRIQERRLTRGKGRARQKARGVTRPAESRTPAVPARPMMSVKRRIRAQLYSWHYFWS